MFHVENLRYSKGKTPGTKTVVCAAFCVKRDTLFGSAIYDCANEHNTYRL